LPSTRGRHSCRSRSPNSATPLMAALKW
jgi:hypothetical protein